MAWVSEIFFTKNPNLKTRKKKYIFCFLCWEGRWLVIFFYKESKSTHFFFFWGGGGVRGMEGVVWRGSSAARVSEFFLQIIQI